jgi:carboxyl-terminal processing protease
MNRNSFSSSNKSPYRFFLPFYLVLAFLAGVAFSIYYIKTHSTFFQKDSKKIDEVLYYLDKFYVDSFNREDVIEIMLNNTLQQLDPHSAYSNAEEDKILEESLEGAFEGIGIQFSIMHDTITVVAAISGGPSQKKGILTGDKIVTVNGENVAGVGIENEQVMKLLRGKKNTKVDVGVKRDGFSEIYNYEIIRDVIPTYTVDVAYMINNETGYIKINQFGATTATEFAKSLQQLKNEGMQALILDLRGNSGGYLDAGIMVCDELLPDGEMIVYTEGLRVKTEKIYATSYGNFEKGKLIVLIDDFSASASEIVAGAVQDNDRGWVVGRRSFGKGLVQRQIKLKDGSSFRITTSRYHTPSGRCIQKDYKDGLDAYYEELANRILNGEMENQDSIKFDDSQKFYTKKGRVVYGGGGIMPDVFVPIDRDDNLQAFYQLLNSGFLSQFAFDYTSKNQDFLKRKFPTPKAFIENMQVSETLYYTLIQQYKKENQKSLSLNSESENRIKLWLKALVGRVLYRDEGFYPVINQIDKTIIEALKLGKENEN